MIWTSVLTLESFRSLLGEDWVVSLSVGSEGPPSLMVRNKTTGWMAHVLLESSDQYKNPEDIIDEMRKRGDLPNE